MPLAILNGFGRSLGDSLIGLQALAVAQHCAAMDVPLLVRRRHGRAMVDQLYDLVDFAEILIVPDNEPDHAPPGFNDVIDIRDFAFDPAFRGTAMIDFFLTRLGVNPTTIPTAAKRNSWLQTRVRAQKPPGLPAQYALVCPGSSMPLRDMPANLHDLVLRDIAHAGLSVVTQGISPRQDVIGVSAMDRIDHLCGLVANATCIVSTDTAMVHLADAFDIPCLAVFTTHRPEWRVRDYPNCTPLHLPPSGLPDALEFARDAADEALVALAWQDGAGTIHDQLIAFLAVLPTRDAGERHDAEGACPLGASA